MTDSGPTSTPTRRAPTLGNWLVDAGWLAAALVVTVAELVEGGSAPMQITAAVIAGAVIAVRRRRPFGALVVGLALALVTVMIADAPTAMLPIAVPLIFGVARRTDRVTAVWAGLGGAATLMLSVFAVLGVDHLLGSEMLTAFAWPTMAAAAGDAARSRAEVVAAALERARRAEQTRDEIARRHVVEERLRIARDLHDVVAHNIAVANVQAGVAEHLLDSDPAAARAAIGHVRTAMQSVLDELANILGVLRSDAGGREPTVPTPTLDDVLELIDRFGNAGLDVTYHATGRSPILQESTKIAAYRLIQEALTNAHKHGDGRVDLAVKFSDDQLRITARNRIADSASAQPSGFGLVGMRERVVAAGGTLNAGRGDHAEFVVDASLPFDPSVPDPPRIGTDR